MKGGRPSRHLPPPKKYLHFSTLSHSLFGVLGSESYALFLMNVTIGEKNKRLGKDLDRLRRLRG
jgi:hypothetical protein